MRGSWFCLGHYRIWSSLLREEIHSIFLVAKSASSCLRKFAEPGLVLGAVHPAKVEVEIAERWKAVGICKSFMFVLEISCYSRTLSHHN